MSEMAGRKKTSQENAMERAKKYLLSSWEKDPRDIEGDVTLWGNLSPYISVVVPTDPWMIFYQRSATGNHYLPHSRHATVLSVNEHN